MPFRTPARAYRRRAALTVLAAAILAGAFASPAAASPSITPIALPRVSISPSDVDVEYPNTFTFKVTAAGSDGSPLSGTVTVTWNGPGGQVQKLQEGPASDFAGGYSVMTSQSTLGLQSVTAKFVPTGIAASASATARFAVKHFDTAVAIAAGATTSSSTTPITVTVTMPDGTPGAGGSVTVKADSSGPSATCTPVPTVDRAAVCTARLPAGLTPGAHTVKATFTGSPIYRDATSGSLPFTVTKSGTGSATSGSGSSSTSVTSKGSTVTTQSAPASASAAPASTDSATPVAILADPASHDSGNGPDPMTLVIATVGACAAIAALVVALYLLIRRRRTPQG